MQHIFKLIILICVNRTQKPLDILTVNCISIIILITLSVIPYCLCPPWNIPSLDILNTMLLMNMEIFIFKLCKIQSVLKEIMF